MFSDHQIRFYNLGDDVLFALQEEEGFIRCCEDNQIPTDSSSESQSFQNKVWGLFEYPDSSFPARCISCWSMFVIGLSITVFSMETLPVFKNHLVKGNKSQHNITTYNSFHFDGELHDIVSQFCATSHPSSHTPLL